VHEMSLAQSILNMAIEAKNSADAKKITKVYLKVGELSGVVPQSLKFCWSLITEDTSASKSELVIESVPVLALCEACQNGFEVEQAVFICPQCNSSEVAIIQGRELTVQSIEAT
jgi:hydrogenase nickel incorporation protein HypA/HybF